MKQLCNTSMKSKHHRVQKTKHQKSTIDKRMRVSPEELTPSCTALWSSSLSNDVVNEWI